MKVATFNVNGVKGRLPRLLEWLEETKPDIACLQEVKTGDATFRTSPSRRRATGSSGTGSRDITELYTFWVNDDAFRRNAGFRMDFLLLRPALRDRLTSTGVDTEQRGREKPSDHAPVWVVLSGL